MEIFAMIGAFAKAYPIPTIVIGILICAFVAYIKGSNTKHYFCTDCGYVVGVQFALDDGLYQTARPCPRCGNNVASPHNPGQGKTIKQGRKNF